jgi:hypothetical protein
MRKLALLAVVAFAAACGSSSSPPPSGNVISGQVGSTSFTSVSQLSFVTSGDACTIPLATGFTLGTSLAMVNVADAAFTCATNCTANSRDLGLIIARVRVAPVTNPATPNPAPGFVTGTYQFIDVSNPVITPGPDGTLAIFTGGLQTFGAATATCDPLVGGTYIIGPGSTLTISSISGTVLTGSVSLNMISTSTGQAGGTLTGTFATDTNCTDSTTPNACVLLNGILSRP